MTSDFSQQSRRVRTASNALTQQSRRQVTLCGIPCRVNGFFAVKRIFACHTLAPPFGAVRMERDQENAAFRGPSKTGFKEMDQRHMNFSQSNGFNLHGSLHRRWWHRRDFRPIVPAEKRRYLLRHARSLTPKVRCGTQSETLRDSSSAR